jgi:glycerophosphoryl diester phosphodiesterase
MYRQSVAAIRVVSETPHRLEARWRRDRRKAKIKVSSTNGFFSGPGPKIFAHRGASASAPENTLESFRLAREQGAPYLEMDVHLSADGAPVIIHDNSVSRTTGRRGRVENMTLSELRNLDAGYKFSTDYGRTFPYRAKGLTIPTLDEVLSTFPRTGVTLELKRTRNGVERAVASMLARHSAEDRVIVASHDHEILARFRQVAPTVATSFSKNEVRDFLARLRDGKLAGYRAPGVAFQVPEYKGLRRVVSKPVIEAVHAFGVEVHVWTVNEPVHITRLLEWGVDGIMTDDPARAFANVSALQSSAVLRDSSHAI